MAIAATIPMKAACAISAAVAAPPIQIAASWAASAIFLNPLIISGNFIAAMMAANIPSAVPRSPKPLINFVTPSISPFIQSVFTVLDTNSAQVFLRMLTLASQLVSAFSTSLSALPTELVKESSMDSYMSQFWIRAKSWEERSLPEISVTCSINSCALSVPSLYAFARAPIASIGSISSPVASAAAITSGIYWRRTSRRPSISPAVHRAPSSISVLVSPMMLSIRARRARAASEPLLWVTAVIVPNAAESWSTPTPTCAATGATIPMPSASFSMVVA